MGQLDDHEFKEGYKELFLYTYKIKHKSLKGGGGVYAFCIYYQQDIKFAFGRANDTMRHIAKKMHQDNE